MQHKLGLIRQAEDKRDTLYGLHFVYPQPIPRSVNLIPKCPPIFNQGELGSCTANAGVFARMMLEDSSPTLLSRMYLYYKERELEGAVSTDGGAEMRDVCKALNKYGVCTEEKWPYDVNAFTKRPSMCANLEALNYKISAYRCLSSDADMDDSKQINQYIALTHKPVLAGINVYESFESDETARGKCAPYPDVSKEQLLGGHAIAFVGYDLDYDVYQNSSERAKEVLKSLGLENAKGAKLLRNSWGEDWGMKGYIWFPDLFITNKLSWDFWTLEK